MFDAVKQPTVTSEIIKILNKILATHDVSKTYQSERGGDNLFYKGI